MNDRLYALPYDATPPQRLRWALDGTPGSHVPLTRPMRRLTPVCANYWSARGGNNLLLKPSEKIALRDEIVGYCRDIAEAVRKRWDDYTLASRWEEAADIASAFCGGGGFKPIANAVYRAERCTYYRANDEHISGGRARVRKSKKSAARN